MSQLRIMLVDDHTLFREGLRLLIQGQGDMLVAGEAGDGAAAAHLAAECQPDIVLMDLHLPVRDGVAATAEVLRAHPACRVIVLTMYHDDDLIERAIRAGASGYLLKDSRSAELLQAIRAVAAGGAAIDPYVTFQLLELYRHAHRAEPVTEQQQDSSPKGEPCIPLTPREIELLEHLAAGLHNRQIAHKLFLSEQTIKNVLSAIYGKLGVSSRTEAVMAAMRLGVLQRR